MPALANGPSPSQIGPQLGALVQLTGPAQCVRTCPPITGHSISTGPQRKRLAMRAAFLSTCIYGDGELGSPALVLLAAYNTRHAAPAGTTARDAAKPPYLLGGQGRALPHEHPRPVPGAVLKPGCSTWLLLWQSVKTPDYFNSKQPKWRLQYN